MLQTHLVALWRCKSNTLPNQSSVDEYVLARLSHGQSQPNRNSLFSENRTPPLPPPPFHIFVL